MIETVSVIENRYKRALSYGKKKDDGRLKRSEKRLAAIERTVTYIVFDRTTITMND